MLGSPNMMSAKSSKQTIQVFPAGMQTTRALTYRARAHLKFAKARARSNKNFLAQSLAR